MKFSFVVPIYNVEAYLERCIESIISQTYGDFEVILVDDGSPDSSLEICRKYEKMDDRISVYSKENGGLSDARNYGLARASGEYVIFVDSDDYIDEKTKLDERQLPANLTIYTPEGTVNGKPSSARSFAEKVGISYEQGEFQH